ncbi:MAG: hypothetical protein M2R45_02999 [Verrucomicrobia subdivision 3 bacterium]|nr:hypothetical protein [Limisphaerales bacterium]MCS1417886.1 hypothetical protein [Limisphaerales bacterium]
MPTAGPALLGAIPCLGAGFLSPLPPIFQRSGCPRSNARLRCGQGLSLRLALKRSAYSPRLRTARSIARGGGRTASYPAPPAHLGQQSQGRPLP